MSTEIVYDVGSILAGTLTVSGDTTISGDLTVEGNFTEELDESLLGDLTLGTATQAGGDITVYKDGSGNKAFFLDASAGQLQLPTTGSGGGLKIGDVEIYEDSSGVLVLGSGDSFGATTFSGNINIGGNITISGAYDILLQDNEATALEFKEGITAYLTFVTTDGGEKIVPGVDFEIGQFVFDDDAGQQVLVDLPVTATPTAGTEESYTLAIDATDILKIYAEADSSGGIQNYFPVIIGASFTEPTASSTYRGALYFKKGGSGTADNLLMCMKSASDTYSWVTIATG